MANNQASKSIVIDYDAIAKQESFKALVRKKSAFLWSMTVIFLGAYMLLPILTSYTYNLTPKSNWGNYLGVALCSRIIHNDMEFLSFVRS